ncbi:MAG TPA: sugar ABC transporter substrate-binding protein, partial [Miltoncostaeaceae bacterium]|nr:sugar ABC transporter substrate-binding protein [Miltoncostaeaceae bacterium]
MLAAVLAAGMVAASPGLGQTAAEPYAPPPTEEQAPAPTAPPPDAQPADAGQAPPPSGDGQGAPTGGGACP